jgi:hypothetical protein
LPPAAMRTEERRQQADAELQRLRHEMGYRDQD